MNHEKQKTKLVDIFNVSSTGLSVDLQKAACKHPLQFCDALWLYSELVTISSQRDGELRTEIPEAKRLFDK